MLLPSGTKSRVRPEFEFYLKGFGNLGLSLLLQTMMIMDVYMSLQVTKSWGPLVDPPAPAQFTPGLVQDASVEESGVLVLLGVSCPLWHKFLHGPPRAMGSVQLPPCPSSPQRA